MKCPDCGGTGFIEVAPGFFQVCADCNARNPVRRPEEPEPARWRDDWPERARETRERWQRACEAGR